jgi:hypothetical protein
MGMERARRYSNKVERERKAIPAKRKPNDLPKNGYSHSRAG